MLLKIKTYSKLIILMAAMLSASCSEIIEININDSHPQLVVEASIGRGEPAVVVLTRSVNLYHTGSFPPVSGAVITISDKEGNSEILTEMNSGIYISVNLKGKSGQTYFLNVENEAETISSSGRIPEYVPVDSFRVVNSIYPGGGPAVLPNQTADFYEVYVTYTDPVDKQNYYRIVLTVNGTISGNNYVYDDRLTNGNQVENLLVVYNPELKAGDSISVEVQCISKSVYEYFKSMGGSSGGPGGSSSPANPYTNLKGATLGFFNPHTVERLQYIIP
jgi:hypothetical protein